MLARTPTKKRVTEKHASAQAAPGFSPLVEEPLAHAVHVAVVDEVRHSIERPDVAAGFRVSGWQQAQAVGKIRGTHEQKSTFGQSKERKQTPSSAHTLSTQKLNKKPTHEKRPRNHENTKAKAEPASGRGDKKKSHLAVEGRKQIQPGSAHLSCLRRS